jgi:hypothetical protein
MRDIFTLFLHAIVIMMRLARPGGLRSVVAESVLMRHQVLILNRGSEAGSQPSGLGSRHRGSMYVVDASGAGPAIRYRAEAIYADAFSQDAD